MPSSLHALPFYPFPRGMAQGSAVELSLPALILGILSFLGCRVRNHPFPHLSFSSYPLARPLAATPRGASCRQWRKSQQR